MRRETPSVWSSFCPTTHSECHKERDENKGGSEQIIEECKMEREREGEREDELGGHQWPK